MTSMRCVTMFWRAGLYLALLGVWLVLGSVAAFACPYCDSEIGREVSAGIFNGDFWHNALLTLLPVPVLLLIVATIHFGLPGPRQFVPARVRRRTAPGNERPRR